MQISLDVWGSLLFISTTNCLLCLRCIVGRNVSANKKEYLGTFMFVTAFVKNQKQTSRSQTP